jgi:hypothetical protein
MEFKGTSLKKESSKFSMENSQKEPELDLKTINTDILLNYAEEKARFLRTVDLEPKVRANKRNFFE